jgi:hypothetical protein
MELHRRMNEVLRAWASPLALRRRSASIQLVLDDGAESRCFQRLQQTRRQDELQQHFA